MFCFMPIKTLHLDEVDAARREEVISSYSPISRILPVHEYNLDVAIATLIATLVCINFTLRSRITVNRCSIII